MINCNDNKLILDINNMLINLGDNIINNDSLENNSINEIKEISKHFEKTVTTVIILNEYIESVLENKIKNDNDLDIIDKILELGL